MSINAMKKQSLIFFSAISIGILTYSQLTSAGSTGQCISGNCFNGYGVATFSDGGRYEGNFVNEVKTGHGTYTYSDGGRYQGNFENDLMNGYGVYEYADGNSYEGDFVNGMKSGYGVYKYSDGSLYKGNFTNENQTGKGVFIATNGNKYPMYNGEISGESSNAVANQPTVSTSREVVKNETENSPKNTANAQATGGAIVLDTNTVGGQLGALAILGGMALGKMAETLPKSTNGTSSQNHSSQKDMNYIDCNAFCEAEKEKIEAHCVGLNDENGIGSKTFGLKEYSGSDKYKCEMKALEFESSCRNTHRC